MSCATCEEMEDARWEARQLIFKQAEEYARANNTEVAIFLEARGSYRFTTLAAATAHRIPYIRIIQNVQPVADE